jgi:hypothetical protein
LRQRVGNRNRKKAGSYAALDHMMPTLFKVDTERSDHAKRVAGAAEANKQKPRNID